MNLRFEGTFSEIMELESYPCEPNGIEPLT